jgi:PAS domain S-box-containing protein
MLIRCSSDLRYRFVSQAYAKMIGRTPEEVVDRPIVESMGEEGFKTILPHVEKVLQGNRVEYESRVHFQGSGERFLHAAYTPEHDERGIVTGWIASILDIADHKRAEQYAQRLALIVESSDDSILSTDLDGIITSWNAGAEWLFGYTAEEVIGRPIAVLIPLDRYGEERGIFDRIRRGERVNHYETVRQHKDGSLLDISLTVSPTEDSEGKIIGAFKIARDVSERRRAQEQQKLLVNEISIASRIHWPLCRRLRRRPCAAHPPPSAKHFFHGYRLLQVRMIC